MKLTAFQSGKGDCLLLTNKTETKRVLIDGGMPIDYSTHVAAALGQLQAQNKKIDLVYVSHVDQDHIGGVLRMLDNEADWRIHEFRKKTKPSLKPPKFPRPPKVLEIWHNAFHEQLDKNAGPVEDMLAAMAPILAGSDIKKIREEALKQSELVTSFGEAVQVSRRISSKQLKIPLNPPSGGKLLMLRPGQAPISLGGMKITILGPTSAHLKTLREEWNKFFETMDGAKQLKRIQDAAKRDEPFLGTSEFEGLMKSLRLGGEMFGKPGDVTTPNLASLTLFVKEGTQTLLLTGDARGDQITDGLKAAGLLADGAQMTVDVMKVPHHGSKNNIDSDFVETVLATDYVFCGNGEHHNPHVQVVEMMARRRLAASPKPFKFWFNSSKAASGKAPADMEAVEKVVRTFASNTPSSRFTFRFLTSGDSLQIL